MHFFKYYIDVHGYEDGHVYICVLHEDRSSYATWDSFQEFLINKNCISAARASNSSGYATGAHAVVDLTSHGGPRT